MRSVGSSIDLNQGSGAITMLALLENAAHQEKVEFEMIKLLQACITAKVSVVSMLFGSTISSACAANKNSRDISFGESVMTQTGPFTPIDLRLSIASKKYS
jgi:hypothetical protein